MAILGIESSAHTFGVGIVEKGRVVANCKSMYGISDKGMIPSKVADFHSLNIAKIIKEAFQHSGLGINDIDAIAYTKGPGIGTCLRIGQIAARTLSIKHNLPIYPVNHAVAHVEIAKQVCEADDPLILYVSGGNSQILGISDIPFKHYRIYGETFDIGVGNMLDVFARAASLRPAWGSTVAKVAEKGEYVRMPYTVKGMNFTFTGLLTYAIKMLKSNRIEDVAYSLQETAFTMLTEAVERTLLMSGKRWLLICGGVAQSLSLQYMMKSMASLHRIKFAVAPNEFNADNGAMIALVGEKMYRSGMPVNMGDAGTNQHYRIDKVELRW